MKLIGLVGDNEVIITIDPGATHSFISLNIVASLGNPVTDSGDFGVSLQNGEAIKGQEICNSVWLQLNKGMELAKDFLPSNLRGSDVT